jgi:hypothetical protein
MLEILRTQWHAGLPFATLIELRDELDTMLHRIRAERDIRPPVIRCSRCGHVGEAAEPDVTVRAMILSLGRFGVAPAEQVKTLKKRWPIAPAFTQQRTLSRRRCAQRRRVDGSGERDGSLQCGAACSTEAPTAMCSQACCRHLKVKGAEGTSQSAKIVKVLLH